MLTGSNMVQADVDNSGTIDYGEFIAATIHLNKLEREENLVAAFSYFDKDGSGYLTIDELQQACKEHNMTDSFIEDIIKEVDQDNVSIFSSTLLRVFTEKHFTVIFFFFCTVKFCTKKLCNLHSLHINI